MTKLAILSDIHGNLPALQAVLEDIKNFDVDQVVVAGDVINFGPFSNQTAKFIIDSNWPAIRGNNEYFLLDSGTSRGEKEWNDPLLFSPTIWTNQRFDPKLKDVISTWPDTINLRYNDAPPIQIFHGTPNSSWDSIFWTMADDEIEKILSNIEADFLVCGHTHLPMNRQVNKWHIFNPGSVGIPLDGIFSSSYMILEGGEKGWTPTFRRVPFNYDLIFEEFNTSGFISECAPIGKLVIELFKKARPTFGFLKWWKTNKPNSTITIELIDEYFNENWLDYSHPAYHINR